jgi:hypothetical protein
MWPKGNPFGSISGLPTTRQVTRLDTQTEAFLLRVSSERHCGLSDFHDLAGIQMVAGLLEDF